MPTTAKKSGMPSIMRAATLDRDLNSGPGVFIISERVAGGPQPTPPGRIESENVVMRRKVLGSAIGIASSLGLGAALLPCGRTRHRHGRSRPCRPRGGRLCRGGHRERGRECGGGLSHLRRVGSSAPTTRWRWEASRNWAALGIYVVVMAIVARLVTHLTDAREAACPGGERPADLLDLSSCSWPRAPSCGAPSWRRSATPSTSTGWRCSSPSEVGLRSSRRRGRPRL